MVSILVDAGRMHLTKTDWVELLEILSNMTERRIVELHAAEFYNGNGVWRGLDGPLRADVTTAILDWIANRKHHIVYSSVLKKSYYDPLKAGELLEGLDTLWRFLGFHLALAIQRYCQPEKKNKGNTFLVFDNQEREKIGFNDIVKNPQSGAMRTMDGVRSSDSLTN